MILVVRMFESVFERNSTRSRISIPRCCLFLMVRMNWACIAVLVALV